MSLISRLLGGPISGHFFTTDGEWWRVFTSLFIHFEIIHLAFNMWALATFGPLTERLFGSVNYLLIYLAAGVSGSLASISWRPDINSAGASGAIFGVLGSLLAAHLRTGETFPSSVLRPLRNSTLIFAGYALLSGLQHEGIDNAAHLGGLAAGFLFGLVMARDPSRARVPTHAAIWDALLDLSRWRLPFLPSDSGSRKALPPLWSARVCIDVLPIGSVSASP